MRSWHKRYVKEICLKDLQDWSILLTNQLITAIWKDMECLIIMMAEHTKDKFSMENRMAKEYNFCQ